MLNTPWAEREIFKALQVIAAETETDLGEIIDALTGYAWGEEEREDLRKMIPDILADIEDVPKPTPEPPKPTGEQLKHYICKGCKDARVNNTACLNWDRCQLGESFGNGMYKYLRRLWTPKPAEQPAQMICDHAGECKGDFYCADRVPHTKCSDCSDPSCSQFSHRICVPWVEPVKESKELPDGMFSERNPNGQTYCERLWCEFRMQKETPKQPEPAAPVIRVCEQCGAVARNSLVNICSSCGGGFVKPKEPKAEPVMIGCKIIGGKGNELWIVDMPWGNSIALYKAVGRKDFDHIELKSGATVTTLSAFDENDPPVTAWFRKDA